LVLIALTAGCRSGGPVADGGPDDPFFSDADGAGGGASTRGLDGRGSIATTAEEAERLRQQQALMQNIVVYFNFDQSDILPEFNDMLTAHAQYLTTNPGASVRLEGHADETGSREYNIGLGERRAQAVRRILMLQGASASQLTTVSYGEERPAALGSDEESYSLNRRVELVYE
jgi:peptidoglycan-associated lipoprotein